MGSWLAFWSALLTWDSRGDCDGKLEIGLRRGEREGARGRPRGPLEQAVAGVNKSAGQRAADRIDFAVILGVVHGGAALSCSLARGVGLTLRRSRVLLYYIRGPASTRAPKTLKRETARRSAFPISTFSARGSPTSTMVS